MALHGCYCHHIELTKPGRNLENIGFSSSISVHKLLKVKSSTHDLPRNDRFLRFQMEMRETEVPASKYGTNGRAVKMIPANEVLKRKTSSVKKVDTINGSKQAVNGVGIVRKDSTPVLTEAMKFGKSKKLPPLGELKVLPSDEGFSWANENYNSWQRSADVWSFVLSLRIRVLLDNAKWAYLGGFTEEKQVGFGDAKLLFHVGF